MPMKRCRICWEIKNWTSAWIDIFAEQNVHLIRQIYSITGVQLTNLNELPNQMCNTCHINLDTAIKFRQRCILSQKQIKIADDPGESFCEAIDNNHNSVENLEDLIEEAYEEDNEQVEEDIDSQIEQYFIKTEEDVVDDKETEFEFEAKSEISKPLEYKKKTTNTKPAKSKAKNVGPFVCDICGNTLSSAVGLREHKLRHAGLKNFICKTCRKSFYTRRDLIRHTRTHTGERPYACKYCSTTFPELGILKQHERRHTNSRSYKCNICDKSFFSSSCLSKHRLIH